MISKTLKPLLFINLLYFIVACTNSTDSTSKQGADTVASSPTVSTEVATEETVTTDTTKKDGLKETSEPKTEPSAEAKAKAKEPAAGKAFKKVTGVESQPVAAPKAAEAENPNIKKGEALIAKSDCFACHNVDEKLVGPAYKDVAKKYEASSKNVDYLAGKIINGGTGVWGEVYMAPHPSVSQEDARAMAEYILSLK